MKSATKLLNLLTAFLAVIGICAATLVCFIVAYTQINGGFSPKRTTGNNTVVAHADNNIIGTFSSSTDQNNNFVPEDLSNSNEYETESLSLTPDPEPDKNNDVPQEYASALSKAMNYSDMMYMSKAAIYDQLVSAYGENLPADVAQYAIDNLDTDWNLNALQKAKNYSDTMYMSKAAIYDQLISDYGEKFTPSEAQYAIDNLVADWNSNALQTAKNYQNTMNMLPDEIYEQLISEYGEKFTPSEADYAVSNMGISNTSNSVLYAMPVEQGTSSTGFIADAPTQSEGTYNSNENNFNSYNYPETPASASVTDTVWLSETGEKYHSIDHCGQMNPHKARQVSLEYAVSAGYDKCEKCF